MERLLPIFLWVFVIFAGIVLIVVALFFSKTNTPVLIVIGSLMVILGLAMAVRKMNETL